MRRPGTKAIWLIALTGSVAATLTGLKVFAPWDQVTFLWEADLHPLALLGHPHLPRYLVALPGLVLGSYLPTTGFSLYVSLFLATNCAVWSQLVLLSSGKHARYWCWIVFLIAHLAMNGRGVFAWTAWLLCAYIATKLANPSNRAARHIPLMLLALFLATVSTGVFAVTFLTLLFFSIKYWRSNRRRLSRISRLTRLFGAGIVFYLFYDFFLLSVHKNIEFYGGGFSGFVNMFEHGLGIVFGSGTFGPWMLLFVFLLAAIGILRLAFGRPLKPISWLVILPVGGGLFGFTVLTLGIPTLLAWLNGARPQGLAPARANDRTHSHAT